MVINFCISSGHNPLAFLARPFYKYLFFANIILRFLSLSLLWINLLVLEFLSIRLFSLLSRRFALLAIRLT